MQMTMREKVYDFNGTWCDMERFLEVFYLLFEYVYQIEKGGVIFCTNFVLVLRFQFTCHKLHLPYGRDPLNCLSFCLTLSFFFFEKC